MDIIENQLRNLLRILKLKIKKTEAAPNPFALIENESRYYKSKLKSAGPSFAKIFVQITAYEYLAERNIDPTIRENCRTYESIIRSQHFEYRVSFYVRFEQDFTNAHEHRQLLNVNNVDKNLGQKEFTAPDCINNIILESSFFAKLEDMELNGSAWRYLGKKIWMLQLPN